MSVETVANAAYLVAALLFILSLAGLSKHETARRGLTFGIAGMALALIATVVLVFDHKPATLGIILMVVAVIVGAGIGFMRARSVQMTEMPELIALLDSPAARPLVQELLAAIGTAFSHTASVRDPLPDTAPDSPEQGLAVLAGIDHLRAILSHLDASWQVTTDQRMRAADAARDVRAAKQGRAAAHEIALARRISPASSAFSLASSHRLVAQMPRLRDALAAVRAEVAKIVWPTRREVTTTTIMVLLMAGLASAFFFVVDVLIRQGLTLLLRVVGG